MNLNQAFLTHYYLLKGLKTPTFTLMRAILKFVQHKKLRIGFRFFCMFNTFLFIVCSFPSMLVDFENFITANSLVTPFNLNDITHFHTQLYVQFLISLKN